MQATAPLKDEILKKAHTQLWCKFLFFVIQFRIIPQRVKVKQQLTLQYTMHI